MRRAATPGAHPDLAMRRRPRVPACALAVVAISLLCLGAPSAGIAATSSTGPAEETLLIYLTKPGQPRRDVLGFKVYAAQGVAVAYTLSSVFATEEGRGVTYATSIPRRSLAGRIDVRFPGLGHLVGRFRSGGQTAAAEEECRAAPEGESGTFVGSIVFRGSGGYVSWKVGHAHAVLQGRPIPGCATARPRPPSERRDPAEYVGDFGPRFIGGSDAPVSELRVFNPGHRRDVDFFAHVYGRGPGEAVNFTVLDYERLGHGVLCNRWINSSRVPRRDRFEIAPGAARPKSAMVRPPSPFGGEATYSKRTRTFLGDLSVHLLGRTVRLAGKDAEAITENQI